MITYLRWRDATYAEHQYRVCDLSKRLQLSETVGTFVRETDEFVTVALDCFPVEKEGEEAEYRHIANVPKSCIERRVDFQVPDEESPRLTAEPKTSYRTEIKDLLFSLGRADLAVRLTEGDKVNNG